MLYAGESLVCAVHEIAVAAVFAIPAIAAEKADADALADVPAFDAGTDDIDLSDRFVTRTRGYWIGKIPSTVMASEWHTPQASTRMRTWPADGSSSGFSV